MCTAPGMAALEVVLPSGTVVMVRPVASVVRSTVTLGCPIHLPKLTIGQTGTCRRPVLKDGGLRTPWQPLLDSIRMGKCSLVALATTTTRTILPAVARIEALGTNEGWGWESCSKAVLVGSFAASFSDISAATVSLPGGSVPLPARPVAWLIIGGIDYFSCLTEQASHGASIFPPSIATRAAGLSTAPTAAAAVPPQYGRLLFSDSGDPSAVPLSRSGPSFKAVEGPPGSYSRRLPPPLHLTALPIDSQLSPPVVIPQQSDSSRMKRSRSYDAVNHAHVSLGGRSRHSSRSRSRSLSLDTRGRAWETDASAQMSDGTELRMQGRSGRSRSKGRRSASHTRSRSGSSDSLSRYRRPRSAGVDPAASSHREMCGDGDGRGRDGRGADARDTWDDEEIRREMVRLQMRLRGGEDPRKELTRGSCRTQRCAGACGKLHLGDAGFFPYLCKRTRCMNPYATEPCFLWHQSDMDVLDRHLSPDKRLLLRALILYHAETLAHPRTAPPSASSSQHLHPPRAHAKGQRGRGGSIERAASLADPPDNDHVASEPTHDAMAHPSPHGDGASDEPPDEARQSKRRKVIRGEGRAMEVYPDIVRLLSPHRVEQLDQMMAKGPLGAQLSLNTCALSKPTAKRRCFDSCARLHQGDDGFHPRMCRWGSECLHVIGDTDDCNFYHEEDLYGLRGLSKDIFAEAMLVVRDWAERVREHKEYCRHWKSSQPWRPE